MLLLISYDSPDRNCRVGIWIEHSNKVIIHNQNTKGLNSKDSLLPTSDPSQEARIARRQHYRAVRESLELQAKKLSSDQEKKVM